MLEILIRNLPLPCSRNHLCVSSMMMRSTRAIVTAISMGQPKSPEDPVAGGLMIEDWIAGAHKWIVSWITAYGK